MTHVAQTSLTAYHTKVLPYLPESQLRVYKIIKDATVKGFDVTNQEISNILKIGINRVTPRTKELRDLNLVVLSCVREQEGGNLAKAWKTTPEKDAKP